MVAMDGGADPREATTTTSPMAPAITTATPGDEASVVAVLQLAFAADPAVRWLYADPHRYVTDGPAFVRAYAGRAFDHGTAYHTADYTGAALWLPPGVRPDEDALVALLMRSVPEQDQATVFATLEQMDAYHPTDPHWYLPIVGVDPTWQGRGIGAALLRHTLAQCDRDQLPAYLESSNPRNVSLYMQHGFEVVDTVQMGTAPPLQPMIRKPHPVP